MTFRVWHERQARMTIHCAYDQLVRVADLKPHPKNPNTHSAAQIAAIASVVEGNGWRAPRSGHAARVRASPGGLPGLRERTGRACRQLADNHLAELAEIDEDRLV